jgi:YD repeat-containing protein
VVSVIDAAGKTTTYAYDPFGKLIQTTDPVGNVVTATYDVRGRKIASTDPDLGHWTYTYDTANELSSQTDAKNQTATFSYDVLGRMTGRVEPDMTSQWVYDGAANGIGKLNYEAITAGPSAGWARGFQYDSLGRPALISTAVDGNAYTFTATYDGNSRLSTVTFPSSASLTYTYTSLGYAQQVTGLGGQVHWTANARDAELRLTQQTAGNGVVTSQSFDPQTGRLTAILAGTGNIVENFSYTYDVLGNVLTRADANQNLTETFAYDALNRMTSATVSQNAPAKSFGYDAPSTGSGRQPAVEVRRRQLRLSARGVCSSPRGDQHHRRQYQHHLHLRLQRQPDHRPRPQHQLHLLQQAVGDHPRVGHAVLLS